MERNHRHIWFPAKTSHTVLEAYPYPTPCDGIRGNLNTDPYTPRVIAVDGIEMHALRRPCQRHNTPLAPRGLDRMAQLDANLHEGSRAGSACASWGCHNHDDFRKDLGLQGSSHNPLDKYILCLEGRYCLQSQCAELYQTRFLIPPLPVEPIGLRKASRRLAG